MGDISYEQLLLEVSKDSFFEIDENDLSSANFVQPICLAKYLMSFLIELDILDSTQVDPEKNFDLVSRIRHNKKEPVLSVLEKNQIHFFNDHYDQLKKALIHFQK